MLLIIEQCSSIFNREQMPEELCHLVVFWLQALVGSGQMQVAFYANCMVAHCQSLTTGTALAWEKEIENSSGKADF